MKHRCHAFTPFICVLLLILFGCGEGTASNSASTGAETDNETSDLHELFSDLYFVDPSSTELRTDEQYKTITDEILRLDAKKKDVTAPDFWVFYIQRDGNYWADSVHENKALAFGRQDRLIAAEKVAPGDCRVGWVNYPDKE